MMDLRNLDQVLEPFRSKPIVAETGSMVQTTLAAYFAEHEQDVEVHVETSDDRINISVRLLPTSAVIQIEMGPGPKPTLEERMVAWERVKSQKVVVSVEGD